VLTNIIRVVNSRRMRWAGLVARMGDRKGTYTVSVGKPMGRRPLGRPMPRWEDNIQTSLKEVEWGGMYWTDLAQVRVQVADGCGCSYEPSGSTKCSQFID